MTTKKITAILTPEEKAHRATQARRRVRAVVRLAWQFAFWLEDLENATLGENVAKNIKILTHRKMKKSKFTLEQKRIMNVSKENRTEEEKKKLQRVLSGIRCFRRYPPSVKAQLASVTYFQYYGAGRTIVRQDDDAQALYFVLSGQVAVSQLSLDPILNEWVTADMGVMEAGAMFGEVSLLHGVKRTATIRTVEDCELLKLRKEDFDEILKETVLAEWEDIRHCMSLFTSYFEDWDPITIRDCCILSKVKYYKVDDIILSDDIGDKKYVYFIVEGKCSLIEHLTVKVTKKDERRRTLELVDADNIKREESLVQMYMQPKLLLDRNISDSTMNLTDKSQLKVQQQTLMDGLKKKMTKKLSDHESHKKLTVRKVKNETHFLRVAIFNSLATFNIGEHFNRRFVVADKKTKMLLIPRYWLVQKNKELWSHIKVFLNQRLPNTEGLYREFLQHRKWMDYRKGIVNEILQQCKKVNTNNIHNVPYSIRINEELGQSETNQYQLKFR